MSRARMKLTPVAGGNKVDPVMFPVFTTAVRYACSCTICGWQGKRTLETLNQLKPCPNCHRQNVFPNNSAVTRLDFGR